MIITLKGCTATAFISGLDFFSVRRGTVSGANVTISTSTINKDAATSTSARDIATVALKSNYENLVVTVTMGGATVSWFAGGKVTIPANTAVTGDIKISASATAISTGGDTPSNLLSLGTLHENTVTTSTTDTTLMKSNDYFTYVEVPVSPNTAYISVGARRVFFLDSSKSAISASINANNNTPQGSFTTPDNCVYVTISYKYVDLQPSDAVLTLN